MAHMKHSPTPWNQRHERMIEDANGRGVVYVDTRPDTDATEDLDGPNAVRIVVCVNACEELPDPSMLTETIAHLKMTATRNDRAADFADFVLRRLGVSS